VSGRSDAYPPPQLSSPAADVDASPEGPDVGAFFDLDGTLVAGYTAAAQTRDRLRHRDLRVVEFLTIVELAVQFRLGRRAFETLIEGSALTVRGRAEREVDEMGERIFRQSVADLIYPEMRELVRGHQRRGHTVVLSSSALTNQVAPVARYLGIEHIVCNRLAADEQGRLTGEIEQPVVWGPTKAGRNTAKLNPGTVDITVLPPVSVEGWTLLNLRERIEQVRASYQETLAEWPTRA